MKTRFIGSVVYLQEVHNEKFDARLCEHCGYKATKRNLLLYHLLTKHKIPPPANYSFPKCEHCEYYALSEALLVKHRNVHSAESINKEMFICKVCRAGFKTATALNGHIQMKSHWVGTNQRVSSHAEPYPPQKVGFSISRALPS